MASGISTLAVHAGEEKRKPYGAVTTPIVQTSTYTFADSAEIADFMHAKAAGAWPVRDEYGRYSNPTQSAAERKLAALEGGQSALLFSSGMNAITCTLLTLLSSGDHLIFVSDAYHRTREFASKYLPRWGIECTPVLVDQPAELEAAVRVNTTLVLAETPTNPYLRVLDLARTAQVAKKHGIVTIVDSTMASPVNLRPLEHGVDMVVHSATKYLGGHNDLLAGAVIGSRKLVEGIEQMRCILGGISNPNEAYLLLRGLKTLELRVQRQNQNGLKVARFLESHPAVRRVYYPGLASHPDHESASRQMAGFGGVVSFEIAGDFGDTGRFIDALRIPYIGPTFGGVESIIEQPAALLSLDPSERAAAGITDNLVRYALGIEDADDLIADLGQALATIQPGAAVLGGQGGAR
jgi:cystathionine gamma-synthase